MTPSWTPSSTRCSPQAACDWRPLANILDASLISLPVPTLRSRLDAALGEAVDEFTQQFFELLAKLVDRTLFGLVEWLPNQCCNYFFFRSVVIQENEGASRTTTESRFEVPNPGFGSHGGSSANGPLQTSREKGNTIIGWRGMNTS